MPYCSHCGRNDAPAYQGGDRSDRRRLDRHRRADWDPNDPTPDKLHDIELCASTLLGLRVGEVCRCGSPYCQRTQQTQEAR